RRADHGSHAATWFLRAPSEPAHSPTPGGPGDPRAPPHGGPLWHHHRVTRAQVQTAALGVVTQQVAVAHPHDLPLALIAGPDDPDAVAIGEVTEAAGQRDRLHQRHPPPERIGAGLRDLPG